VVEPLPRLQAIVDVDTAVRHRWTPLDLSRGFLDGGARLLQLRAKSMPSGPLLELVDALVEMARPYDAAIVVNDRPDLARLAGAAGVHVGQDDLPPSAARRLVGDSAIVGCSTHTAEQIDAACGEPVSYIAVGPVFGTRTKDTGYSAVGLALVAHAASRAGPTPIVAIGGVTLDNAAAVIAAGASSVAVIGDLLVGGDPAARVRAYAERLGPL
jgi:thiamine-phosphate pyrophosphorylase